MISAILVVFVLVWWAVERLALAREHSCETKRRGEVLALRQRYVGVRPDDPVAHERLGDALRESGYPEEAIQAYAASERLYAGNQAGINLASKIRLTRLALTERNNPAQLMQTLETRESVCRRCGKLNLPHAESCDHCGSALLVSGFWGTTTRNGKMRGDLLREVWPLLAKSAVILVAIASATFLPNEARFATLIAALGVVPFALLKQLGDPTLTE